MNLPINDSRNLAVALLDPASGLFHDATADALSPFDPTRHLRPAAPIKVQVATPAAGATWKLPDGLFAGLKNTDVGKALFERTNLVPVWFVVDSANNPTSVSDVWPNPFAAQWPVVAGGCAR